MRDRARVFVLAAIAVGTVLPCRPQPGCTRGDMLARMSPKLRESFQKDEKQWGWMHDVTICKAGGFTIYSPASGGEDRIMVMRGEEGVFTRASGSSMLYRNGEPVVTLTDAENPADSPTLNYEVRDASGSLSVFDRNFDGQADFRVRFVRGQKPFGENWVDGQWVHTFIQDGVHGYLRDGRFVPLRPEHGQHGE
jgi:hypothetical protein